MTIWLNSPAVTPVRRDFGRIWSRRTRRILAAGAGDGPFTVTLSSAGVEIPRAPGRGGIRHGQSSAAQKRRREALHRRTTGFPGIPPASVNNCAIAVVHQVIGDNEIIRHHRKVYSS